MKTRIVPFQPDILNARFKITFQKFCQKQCKWLAILLLNLSAWPAFTQDSPPSTVDTTHLTAEEILQHADHHFQKQNFPQAAGLYLSFLETYGSAAEVKPHLPKIRVHAVIASAKAGDFARALEHHRAEDYASLESPSLQLAWLVAICQAQFDAGEPEKARAHLGQIFQHPAAEASHREEVLLLALQSFGIEAQWQEAVAFYQKQQAHFEAAAPSLRDPSRLFYVHALIQAEDWETAKAALLQPSTTKPSTRTWLHEQSLSWQLAEAFLTREQWDPAAQMLLGLRPYEELMSRLSHRLADLERKLPNKPTTQDPISRAVLKEHGELMELQKSFEAFEHYDAIVRLRLASCFQALERYREAAFVLDHMIRQMPASEVTESASASLLRLWILQERWSRAIRSAELYEKRFEDFETTPHRPEILFLKGQAYQGLGHFQEAAQTFSQLAQQFPDHEWSQQALFLEAHQFLHLHQEEEAIAKFANLQASAQEPLREEVDYWLAMAHYFAQQWSEARVHFETYQARGAEGMYQRDVAYRVAYTYFSETQYEESLKLLAAWQEHYPEKNALDALADEVRLTQGDALGATGELEAALAAYAAIPIDTLQPSFFDEAQFKIAQVHRVLKQESAYVETLEKFLEARPQSPKVPEALHALGKYFRSKEQPQKAQQLFWDSLTRLGNLEDQEGLEEMMLTLLQWHSKASFPELAQTIERKLSEALVLKQERWQQRLLWFKAIAHEKQKSPEAAAQRRHWQQEVKPKLCSPRILLDLAQKQRDEKAWDLAKQTLETLRRFHPKSIYKDQAWLGLAQIHVIQKRPREALQAFEKWHRYTLSAKTPSPDSNVELVEGSDNGQAMLQWAQACLQFPEEHAAHGEQIHLAIFKHKAYPPKLKAAALFSYAEHLAHTSHPREAIAFYEQIYLLYPSHQPYAAQSYLGRGKCLQQLELYRQAQEVYAALLKQNDSESVACHAQAKLALASLPTPATSPKP